MRKKELNVRFEGFMLRLYSRELFLLNLSVMGDTMAKKTDLQFHVLKCDLFDEVTIELSKTAERLISTAGTDVTELIDSKRSVKEGMEAVRKSPFKTVFVFDAEKQRPIYALSQNSEFIIRARKKKGGGDRPPLPPDDLTQCCEECLRTGQGCFVTEGLNCICIDAIEKDGIPIGTPLGEVPI